jgi:hypothetical protein
MRKRALCGAVVLAVTLALVGAPAASAAEAPQKSLAGLWTTIETWFQGFLAGWLSPEPLESTYGAELLCSPTTLGCVDSHHGGGSGGSTTDDGNVIDPDG